MTANTETAHSQVDEALNETEFGAVIAANKNLFITLIIVVLVAVLGFGFYSVNKNKANGELSSKVFEFQTANLAKLTEKKMTVAQYTSAFNTLFTEVDGFEGIAPLLFASVDEMVKQGALKEAKDLLAKASFGNEFVSYFASLRTAAIEEDLGNIDGAISALESLKLPLMESKVNLDLGRLYRAKGDTAKAKEFFEKVSANVTQAEFSKLAKLYLSEL